MDFVPPVELAARPAGFHGASRRGYGLDVCRALAILMVVTAHLCESFFVAPSFFPMLYSLTGWIGVELFFSLSGFLIGRILIDVFEEPRSGAGLMNFYARRWLRTLPAYFAVLAGLCLIYRQLDWRSFLFLQPLRPYSQSLMPVSWSLVMEEYFYLLFPLLILAARRLRSRSPVLAATLLLVCLWPGLRVAAILLRPPFDDFSFHAHALMRLDCCAYGVLAAWLRHRFPDGVRHFCARWHPAAVMATALVAVAGWAWLIQLMIDRQPLMISLGMVHWGPYYFALQSTVLDVLAAWLVLYASHVASAPARLLDRPVRAVSRLSYGLYLTNGSLLSLALAYTGLSRGSWWGCAVMAAAMMIAAFMLYLAVERPFLVWRDRFVPASKRVDGRFPGAHRRDVLERAEPHGIAGLHGGAAEMRHHEDIGQLGEA